MSGKDRKLVNCKIKHNFNLHRIETNEIQQKSLQQQEKDAVRELLGI